MSRRQFLRSSMGAATTLLTLAACSKESAGDGAVPAGTFTLPPEATTETTAAQGAIGPTDEEVIVDLQTHFLDPDTQGFGAGFPQAACGDDASLCFTIDRWADLVFASSDTSVAVLSALPIVADDHPMSMAKMEAARRLAEALCGDGRVLLQAEAFPQVGELADSLDRMSAAVEEHDIVAWKTYTHIGGGYRFTDDVGEAFLGQVQGLTEGGDAPDIVAVHKGFGADPADVGPAAAAWPDLRFVIYHSGFEPGGSEGPFAEDGGGVDRLIRSLRDAGIGPGSNVYAELGSTWRYLLGAPDQAGHVLGKLLAAVGPDRLVWGTDSVWYGSPQDQIEAFRAFEITPEAQEQFGYPALTPELKRAVLGGNAAGLHGIDLAAVAGPCRFTPDEREAAREQAFAGTLGPVTPADVAATFARDHPWL